MVPYLTACLITMATLAISFKASAEQRRVDVMFARDVVNREAVGVFEPGGYWDKEAGFFETGASHRLGNGKKGDFL